jgi:hypothetical protein
MKFSSLEAFVSHYVETAIEQRDLLYLKVGKRAIDGLSESIGHQISIAATRDLSNEDMAVLIAGDPSMLLMQFPGNTNLGTSPTIGRIFGDCLRDLLDKRIKNEWRSRPVPEATETE